MSKAKGHDFAAVARRVVEQAIGEKLDGSPLEAGMRRFTRLTNAFSKKVENHAAMLSLYFMFYNFARVHQTLRVTPAMEAKLSDHVWSVEEIVALMDAA